MSASTHGAVAPRPVWLTLQIIDGDLAPLEFTRSGPLDDAGREALARQYASLYPRRDNRASAAACHALISVDIHDRGGVTTRDQAVDESAMPVLGRRGDRMAPALCGERIRTTHAHL